MKILVTGGAGYIGSVMTSYFIEGGNEVIVLDSLIRGHRTSVSKKARFIQADLKETSKVLSKSDKIDAVVHLAALANVSESVSEPNLYWENNVGGTLALLKSLSELQIPHFVFASSCAVYGTPNSLPITEETPTSPINPYGMTKLAMDMAIKSLAEAYGFSATSLRFFNVAGAYNKIGERHSPETHIIPLALEVAAGIQKHFTIFGDDYDTPDGTCIRDYIHVLDLADAVLAALKKYMPGVHSIYNLGNGDGYSNKDVIRKVEQITGKKININIGSRRPGDPAKLISSSEKIKNDLGWSPSRPRLEDMIESAWSFLQNSQT